MENTSENQVFEKFQEPIVLPDSTNTYNSKRLWIISVAVISFILLIDQILKVWVKTHMHMGEEIHVMGNWFILHYTENMGMAFGLELGGKYGKLILTTFRLVAVGFGIWVLYYHISKRAHKGFILCIALILAGAIGNIIDSVFYGVIFHDINHYSGGWFHGWVVDMFYFPLFEGFYPDWLPIKGGDYFIFFSPVFNIADSAITLGVLLILIFQKKLFIKEETLKVAVTEHKSEVTDNTTTEI